MQEHPMPFWFQKSVKVKISNNPFVDVLPVDFIEVTGAIHDIEIKVQLTSADQFVTSSGLGVHYDSDNKTKIVFDPQKDLYAVEIVDNTPGVGNITGIHIGVCIIDGM